MGKSWLQAYSQRTNCFLDIGEPLPYWQPPAYLPPHLQRGRNPMWHKALDVADSVPPTPPPAPGNLLTPHPQHCRNAESHASHQGCGVTDRGGSMVNISLDLTESIPVEFLRDVPDVTGY